MVLVTSAMVYGARPENQVPLAGGCAAAGRSGRSIAGDLLEIEHLARRAPRAYPGMQVTVVRPAALVGDDVDTLITRHFEAPRLLTVKGCATRWQFCHVDDLVSALELAVVGEVTGEFAVGCDGWLDQDRVEELSGLRRIELPAGFTFGTVQRLHRAGITPAPATDLHYVVYPWVVECATLRAVGLAARIRQRDRTCRAARAARRASCGGRPAAGAQGGDDHRGRRGGRDRCRDRHRRDRPGARRRRKERHRLTQRAGTV